MLVSFIRFHISMERLNHICLNIIRPYFATQMIYIDVLILKDEIERKEFAIVTAVLFKGNYIPRHEYSRKGRLLFIQFFLIQV